MNGDTNAGSFWIEEINGKVQTEVRKKRKYRTRKKEYNGWGSTSLIWFLESIGQDTSNEITQSEVANIISDYVKRHNLLHPTKKKRVVCDEKLHTLFGRKSISRLKISDLLESHIAKNCEESSDEIFFDSDDDENFLATCETPKPTSLERKCKAKKPAMEKPRSCFAAINPFNIKLVYLKRSLVEKLLNDYESFENKVVGSFIRIRCDPNDYLQKNSHQLLQVTGIKKSSGGDGATRLQASGFIKDISINMLSDDNFSEAECEDLHQRVKGGLLKRPMIVDMEQKARVLHEDITKHWLARELVLLENLIGRANEKGWRRELDEYLQRREKLQSPDEQERLLLEIPQVIADDLESESRMPDVADKKVEKKLQDFWQPTCTKASLVPEVPKTGANGFECKVTNLYEQLQGSDEQERLLHEIPKVIADDLESEPTTLDVADKKVGKRLQDLYQPTCTKASLAAEVPKTVANDFACKVTKRYKKLQGSNEEECLSHEIPHVIEDDLESESPSPDVPDKELESNLQELWQTTNTKTSFVPEVSKAVTDGFACKATKLDITNLAKQESSSPKSILSLSRASEVPPFNMAMNSSMLGRISRDTSTVEEMTPLKGKTLMEQISNKSKLAVDPADPPPSAELSRKIILQKRTRQEADPDLEGYVQPLLNVNQRDAQSCPNVNQRDALGRACSELPPLTPMHSRPPSSAPTSLSKGTREGTIVGSLAQPFFPHIDRSSCFLDFNGIGEVKSLRDKRFPGNVFTDQQLSSLVDKSNYQQMEGQGACRVIEMRSLHNVFHARRAETHNTLGGMDLETENLMKKNQEVDAFERRALEAESKLSVIEKRAIEVENKLLEKEIQLSSLRSLTLTLQTDLNSVSVDRKKVIEEKFALEEGLKAKAGEIARLNSENEKLVHFSINMKKEMDDMKVALAEYSSSSAGFERRALEAESKLSVVDAIEKRAIETESKLVEKEIEVSSLKSLTLTLQTDLNSVSVDKNKVIEEKFALEEGLKAKAGEIARLNSENEKLVHFSIDMKKEMDDMKAALAEYSSSSAGFERRALEAESKLNVVDAIEKGAIEAENKLVEKEIEVSSLKSLTLTLQTDLNSISVDKKKVIEEKFALEEDLKAKVDEITRLNSENEKLVLFAVDRKKEMDDMKAALAVYSYADPERALSQASLPYLEVGVTKVDVDKVVKVDDDSEDKSEHLWSNVPVQQQPAQHTNSAYKKGGIAQPAESNKSKFSQAPPAKQVRPSQIPVIELSDDDEEENEESSTIKQVPPAEQLQSMIWHYRDPQGNMQGPFSIIDLKRWSDACYFTPDFKVWKSGQSQDQGVLLVDILPQFFPRGSTQFSII